MQAYSHTKAQSMTIRLHVEIDGLRHDLDFEGSTAQLEEILRPIGVLNKANPDQEVEEAWIFIRGSQRPDASEVAKLDRLNGSLSLCPPGAVSAGPH